MQTEVIPAAWGEAIICPIHKKGDKSDPGIYKGFILINVIEKTFTKTLNERLVHWVETSGKLCEVQSYFRCG